MADSKLSSNDRYSLECYARTEHRPISFAEVLRMYEGTLRWYGGGLLALSLLAFVFVPSNISIPLNHAVCYCILSVFAWMVFRCVHISRLSIGHWKLLKRILNWERVHALLDEQPETEIEN
jgi:hypothetical protein